MRVDACEVPDLVDGGAPSGSDVVGVFVGEPTVAGVEVAALLADAAAIVFLLRDALLLRQDLIPAKPSKSTQNIATCFELIRNGRGFPTVSSSSSVEFLLLVSNAS